MPKRSVLFTCCFALLALIIFSASSDGWRSTGAPPGHTGAPGESNCAKSGCHVGTAVNGGAGNLQFTISGDVTEYDAASTYTFTVSLNQDSIQRFGFQLLAYDAITDKSMGTLDLVDHQRTQLMDGPNQYEGRQYATYKYEGTEPAGPGLGEWTVNWTAPDISDRPVTIYIAAVAANNDATDDGDEVYTQTITLQPKVALSIAPTVSMEADSWHVFPNPAADQWVIQMPGGNLESTTLALYDLQGKIIQPLFYTAKNREKVVATVPTNLTNGLYLLAIQTSSGLRFEKVCITR